MHPISSGEALQVWVKRNEPDLNRELKCRPMSYARMRLNELLGMDVQAGDIHGAEKFLSALMLRKEAMSK